MLLFFFWRDLKEVNLDVDRFLKDMESVMNHQGFEDMASDDDIEEGSFSDFDFGKFSIIFYVFKWTALYWVFWESGF